jgi:Na+-transporting NADH:ubiquinone oxidoreductase subunit C
MDVNKNSYTFSFAAIMVVVVAALLSTAAIALKPFQSRNVLLEKKQNILSSVGINIQRDEADLK